MIYNPDGHREEVPSKYCSLNITIHNIKFLIKLEAAISNS